MISRHHRHNRRQWERIALLSVALGLLACSDVLVEEGVDIADDAEPTEEQTFIPNPGFIVSEPVSGSAAAPAAGAAAASYVYVSLPTGTTTGTDATITNPANERMTIAVIAQGGFDPVQIAASIGDTLLIAVFDDGQAVFAVAVRVPDEASPIVIRTKPPKKKIDVPLNVAAHVVFSEPIDPRSVTGISLVRDSTLVESDVTVSASAPFAVDVVPVAELEPNTEYTLVITVEISDLSGDTLEEEHRVTFTTVADRAFSMVSAGVAHTCALTGRGTPLCWGNNRSGELGRASRDSQPNPNPEAVAGGLDFVHISAGQDYTCGVDPLGQGWCWGLISTPLMAEPFSVAVPRRIGDAPRLQSIHTSFYREANLDIEVHCGLAEDGRPYCWGQWPDSIVLRDNRISYHFGLADDEPILFDGQPYTALSVGADYACGIRQQGGGFCWGANLAGQLALADTIGYSPTPVSVGSQYASISAGAQHVCAVDPVGRAFCWGNGRHGQLGIGLDTNAFQPQELVGAPRFVTVAAGSVHTCALDGEGRAYCWGRNGDGQAGADPAEGWVLAPRALSTDVRFRSLSAGDAHTCGLSTDYSVYCWGGNWHGQLGDGTTRVSHTPVPVRTP